MTMKRFDGVSWIDLTTKKRFDGVSWIDLTVAKRFDGVNWIDIPLGGGGGALSATVSSGSVYGEDALSGPGSPVFKNVLSDTPATVTVTATGGTAPYTYSWAVAAGSSSCSAVSPTSATTQFSAILGRNQDANSYMRCTVTDSLSATTFVDVAVYLIYYYDSGGGEVPL